MDRSMQHEKQMDQHAMRFAVSKAHWWTYWTIKKICIFLYVNNMWNQDPPVSNTYGCESSNATIECQILNFIY